MLDIVFKILMVIFVSATGYLITFQVAGSQSLARLGLFGGLVLALLAILIGEVLKRSSFRALVGGVLGLIVFLTPANFLAYFFFLNLIQPITVKLLALAFVNFIFGYLGLIVGINQAEKFEPSELQPLSWKGSSAESSKILDTSVIIDGRIADVCQSGFAEGPLIIPQFVLRELQQIADSSDASKRARGRRGLDILNHMREELGLNLKVIDEDFPHIRDVDAKLVALAKKLNAKVVTNDFNLNKVAEIQGVKVLNINDLANALRPVILPGEILMVRVLKEGKETGQGVAYLEDGTMVVVDNGIKYLGKNVEVFITSVLQTAAGRMIFGKPKEEESAEYLQKVL
ncbi:MAG: PIN domain-containing protein [Thermodesulfobacteriota bacterium]